MRRNLGNAAIVTRPPGLGKPPLRAPHLEPGGLPSACRSGLECAHMVSLYLHLPFCRIRCAYCDFNTFAGLDDLVPGYMRALETEIAQVASGLARLAGGAEPPAVHTIYLGGGTPSVVPLARLRSLLQCVRSRFTITSVKSSS